MTETYRIDVMKDSIKLKQQPMKKQSTLLLALIALFNTLCIHAQNEINLISDKGYADGNLYLLSLKKQDNKLIAKYISFPTAGVKSSDESTMNGKVMSTQGAAINGYIALSDIVMVLTEQEVDLTTKVATYTNNHLVALRSVNESKTYQLFFEGYENKLPYLKAGQQVSYNRNTINKIPNISAEELTYLNKVLALFDGGNGRADFEKSMLGATREIQGAKSFLNDVREMQQMFKLPTENENTLKYDVLDDGVEYLITRDRRIKKDVGVAYKSYFVYNKRDLVKVDSVFFADKSDLERPDRVYDLNKNIYSGVLSRLSCEPLISTKKENENYFRYTYFDKDKTLKRYRFQLENGKLNSFNAERTFKIGDTLIHLTTKKTGFLKVDYQSSVFTGDTVKLRYPLSSNDTITIDRLYCGKDAGSNSFFGIAKKVLFNSKVGTRYFVLEQESLSKTTAGLVPANHPEANVMGFSLTKVYVINNNAVEKIKIISVPYFSDRTSNYTLVYQNPKSSVYMIQMGYPILISFKDNGTVNLKEASLGNYSPTPISVNNKYVFEMDNTNYLIYREPSSGKMKLVPMIF